jgi:hypothetical protein
MGRTRRNRRPTRCAAIARVNVDPADAEDAEASLRLRAPNFPQGVEWQTHGVHTEGRVPTLEAAKGEFEVRRKRMAFSWTK